MYYGVLMYVSMIFQTVFIGYSVGASPVISYHYGDQNHEELKGLILFILFVFGFCNFGLLFLYGPE